MRILVVWSSALGVIQINPTFEEVQARKSSGWAEGWLYSRRRGRAREHLLRNTKASVG
jgi:hypothetical protein